MDEILKLQEKYTKGEISKSKYLLELAKLVEAKKVTQEEADDAEDYNPDANKLIYTQADVDSMISRKATQQIRKILKDAGVEVDAGNKELAGKVVDLVKVGAGKAKPPEGVDLDAAKKQSDRITSLSSEMKTLRLENAILKTIGKYNPVSNGPVIALLRSDYAGQIEFIDEDTGEVDIKSMDRAVKRMQLEEPTLFKTAEPGKGDKDDKGGFYGKGPGGNGNGADGSDDQSAKLAKAREMMGIKPAQK